MLTCVSCLASQSEAPVKRGIYDHEEVDLSDLMDDNQKEARGLPTGSGAKAEAGSHAGAATAGPPGARVHTWPLRSVGKAIS